MIYNQMINIFIIMKNKMMFVNKLKELIQILINFQLITIQIHKLYKNKNNLKFLKNKNKHKIHNKMIKNYSIKTMNR